jgi:hypothetical protein
MVLSVNFAAEPVALQVKSVLLPKLLSVRLGAQRSQKNNSVKKKFFVLETI